MDIHVIGSVVSNVGSRKTTSHGLGHVRLSVVLLLRILNPCLLPLIEAPAGFLGLVSSSVVDLSPVTLGRVEDPTVLTFLEVTIVLLGINPLFSTFVELLATFGVLELGGVGKVLPGSVHLIILEASGGVLEPGSILKVIPLLFSFVELPAGLGGIVPVRILLGFISSRVLCKVVNLIIPDPSVLFLFESEGVVGVLPLFFGVIKEPALLLVLELSSVGSVPPLLLVLIILEASLGVLELGGVGSVLPLLSSLIIDPVVGLILETLVLINLNPVLCLLIEVPALLGGPVVVVDPVTFS